MPKEFDKLVLLKSVNIFRNTPDDVLRFAADFLEEVHFKAGEKIFEKGDMGTSMYIIADGMVRVHDGEMLVNYLREQDIFGEMSALDPEPRSASITAEKDTTLFRLDQDSLYELLDTHTGITKGIFQVLTQRMRARMKDMAEDYEYMQQFNRVISAAVAVEAGMYKPESLNEVSQRNDELGQLARVFQRMVREVYAREERLKQQVAELRIEIDKTKQAQKVAEITESEYFQQLRSKVAELRSKKDASK